MNHYIMILGRIISLIKKEKIHKIALFILFLIFSCSLAMIYFEEKLGFADALWWSMVTVTTVGYGDISPATTGGRVVAVVTMLAGIGLLGIFTAAFASLFIENRLLENKGMTSTETENHFIICGWNFRGSEIVEELRADSKTKNLPLVVIAELPEKPVEDEHFHFIRGEVTAQLLEKANLKMAKAVIILSDDKLDSYSRDAKTILTTMTVKNAHPEVYTCVELMDPENVEHCRMAKADEIIVVGEISTNLLVQAAVHHGITRMISELVSNRYGSDLYKIKVPSYCINNSFLEVMCDLKKKHNFICIGVEDSKGKKLFSNPDNDYLVKKDDRLIVISEERPETL